MILPVVSDFMLGNSATTSKLVEPLRLFYAHFDDQVKLIRYSNVNDSTLKEQKITIIKVKERAKKLVECFLHD